MFIGDIKKDFDNLRGDTSLSDIASRLGITHTAVIHALAREHVVAPQVVRLFEQIGYDVSVTYIPKGQSPDAAITDTSSDDIARPTKAPKATFQIRRDRLMLPGQADETAYRFTSSAGMLKAVERMLPDRDLRSLELVAEFTNQIKANSAYQSMKSALVSEEMGSRDIADVLVLTRVDQDGTVTILNKWAGSLKRPRNGKPGRKPKETQSTVNSLSDALKVLSKRE